MAATIFLEIDAARLAADVVALFMAALRAIHTILGPTATENETETVVPTPHNLCDEPHDTAVASEEMAGYRGIIVNVDYCISIPVGLE